MTRIGNTSCQRSGREAQAGMDICGRPAWRTPPTGEREAGTCKPNRVRLPKRFVLSGYQCLGRTCSIQDSLVNCDRCTTALSTKVSDISVGKAWQPQVLVLSAISLLLERAFGLSQRDKGWQSKCC